MKRSQEINISFGDMSEPEIEDILAQRRARRACWGAVIIIMGLLASMSS